MRKRKERVKIFSAGVCAGDDESREELSRQMVWLRTILIQVRRIPQRGQSRHSTGAEGSGVGAGSGGGEESEREALSGHNTALTRRGGERGATLLTWRTQEAGTTMTDACSIQDP